MDKRHKLSVQIGPDEPVYVISAVSRIVHIPIWTLRVLDKKGIIRPKRKEGRTRFYCMKDIELLDYIRYLMEERGVNVSGVRLILQLERRL